ncbi:hypothetical protein ACGFZP_12990 [Kitasatospora sp. NPDC048239]|uniref:hypothetical protein n=1 Tax=Kitasatospora sp. NPDC048239 TaxID=3364046 RepID=UPI00371B9EFB
MTPDDIPTSVTSLVYTDPSGIVLSQNQAAAFLAHYWPAIDQDRGPAPWRETAHPRYGEDGQWIDSRDCTKAARIARGQQ